MSDSSPRLQAELWGWSPVDRTSTTEMPCDSFEKLDTELPVEQFSVVAEDCAASDRKVKRSGDSKETADPQSEYGVGEYGCTHYRRRCKLVAPCCNEVYWCRHCHNDAQALQPDITKRHELDRRQVREVVCAVCDKRQPVSPRCESCGVSFGKYVCLICNFFEDNTTKKQYHCDKCGICRVGGRENFYHCDTCGCCYANALKGCHTCVQDSMASDCPVCLEYLFDSVKPISVLQCGHTIHEDCLSKLRVLSEPGHLSGYTCPMCSKSIYDMSSVWRELDASVAANPMAPEYQGMICQISCNDCHERSEVPFHVWLKCNACGSYNTRKI
uniref:Ring finger and CHY zinc finger domain-containing protein 1 n=1 Tax=Tetraselmis sp. GSL018 TaxID=582737 RepID=A0A061R754_9CHLO